MNTFDLQVATSAVRRGLTAAVVAVALLVGGAWHDHIETSLINPAWKVPLI